MSLPRVRTGAVRSLRFGRGLFIAGLALWVLRLLSMIPYKTNMLLYPLALEWGLVTRHEWVHPLFLPLIGGLRVLLAAFGYSGTMFIPIELFNLAVGALTLTGLFLLAERLGRDSLTAAVGVLHMGFAAVYWSWILPPDPHAFAAAFSAATLGFLIVRVPGRDSRRYFLAGTAAGLTVGFSLAGITLIPVAAFAVWKEAGATRRAWRIFGCFAAAMAGVILVGYLVMAAYYGLNPLDLRWDMILRILHEMADHPSNSFKTGNLAAQTAVFLGHVEGGGGIQKILSLPGLAVVFLIASFLLGLGGTVRDADRRWVKAVLWSNVILYSVFFILNDSTNGFICAIVLPMPLLLTLMVSDHAVMRKVYIAIALLATFGSSWHGRVYPEKQDFIFREASFLKGIIGPGDVIILPGCPFVNMIYSHRFNVLRVDEETVGEYYPCFVPLTESGRLAARVADTIGLGRRVYLLGGAPQAYRAGTAADIEGYKRKFSQLFKSPEIEPRAVVESILAMRKGLEDSFDLECGIRSPQGWEYCVVGLKEGGAAPRSRLAGDLAAVGPDVLAALARTMAAKGPAIEGHRARYLMEWLAESPGDAHAKYDLLSLAASHHGDGLRGALGDDDMTMMVYDALNVIHPQDAGWALGRAGLLMESGRRDEALRILRRVDVQGSNEDTVRRIADLFRRVGDGGGVLAMVRTLAKRDPENAALQIEFAEISMESGRRDEALGILRRVDVEGLDEYTVRRIADLFRRAGDRESFLALLRVSALRSPENAAVQIEFVRLLIESGRRDEALRTLDRSRSLGLGAAELRRMSGIYRSLGEMDSALEAWESAGPGIAGRAHWELDYAELLHEAGKDQEALAALRRAEALELGLPERRRLLLLQRTLGGPAEMLRVAAGLARKYPRDGFLQVEQAELMLRSGREAEALRSFRRAESLGGAGKERDSLARRIARGYQSLGKCALALRVWGEVLSGSPRAKDFSDKAVCEYINGDWERALSDLRQAIAMSPGNLEARLSLGAVYIGRGLPLKAMAVYDKALSLDARGQENVRKQIITARLKLKNAAMTEAANPPSDQ